jgi:hypothetical protein
LYQVELEVFGQLRSSESENEEVDMPKKQHTEEQIIGVLKQYEADARTEEICRKPGISQATFYLWNRQYAGLGVQELQELPQSAGSGILCATGLFLEPRVSRHQN